MVVFVPGAPPAPTFEGVEKRLEVQFSGEGSLRAVPKATWDALLAQAECTIISQEANAHCDAYVLSESSLFVFDRQVVLKTCGTTKLLGAVPGLLQEARRRGLAEARVKFSRANFACPEAQPPAHRTFAREAAFLEAHFGHLAPGGGQACELGDCLRGTRWHVYTCGREAPGAAAPGRAPARARCTLEICMNGLDARAAAVFFKRPGVDADAVAKESGVRALVPQAECFDGCLFEPCGYSMNSLEGPGFCTVHVTPEPDCSYASVEFSNFEGHELSPANALAQVVAAFRPSTVSAALFVDSAAGASEGWLRPLGALKGFDQKVSAGQSTAAGGYTWFYTYTREGLAGVLPISQGGAAAVAAGGGKLEGAAIALPGQDTSSEEMEVRLSGDASSEEEGTQPMDLLETGKREGAAVLEPALPASPASETSDMDVVLVGPRAHPVHSVQRAADAHLDAFCRQAIAEHGLEDSFYVLDLGIVQRRHEVWTSLLPRVTPFYAVKANPDPVLLKTLALLGAGFDVASEAELNLVLSLGGVDPGKRVVYANACKRPRDLCHMAEKSADLTTFDTCSELRKIARHHAGAQCLLRIRADDPDARCQLGNKYGAEMEDVPELVALAKELGLQLVGVSFHVGSGASNPNAFTAAIRLAHDVFSRAWQAGFKDMEILDIGGGFSGGTGCGSKELEPVAAAINAALDALFPAECGVRVIAEPGRYFSEAAATLATPIFGRRRRRGASGEEFDYWVTDGVYGSMNCLLYDHAKISTRPLHVASAGGGGSALSTVFGPTCDGLDTVLRDVRLPRLENGDWLLFPSMGAYTVSAGSNFNGMNMTDPDVFYVQSSSD